MQYTNPYIPPYRETKNSLLEVHGEGVVKATPDRVIITLGIVTEDMTVQAAQEKNATASQALLAALKEMGIPESSIATLSYTITPLYSEEEGKTTLRGYRVEHLYEVTVSHVQQAGEVYSVATKAGANITRGLTFRVSQPTTYINQALTIAITNALEKATVIANTLHVTLHPIPISIKEQVGSYSETYTTARIMTVPSIQPGEVTISARILATFTYT
ncbi:SIMPL domain-containing protein [Ectobacillus sp. sgz5001026]|uniref:SIMPL domain-containing protein n=1 Tax=Ectobacillus sp. sgz5001026 TaxID=3242473 RepID=UPI0036D21CC8